MDSISARLGRLRPGDRVVVRHRLANGSATDVIGRLRSVDPKRLIVLTRSGEVQLEVGSIIVAKQVPSVARGRDPMREDAGRLEQLAVPGWGDRYEPLGEWILRSAGGFSSRANSCLATGDPGRPIGEAAAAVVAYARREGIPAMVQVIEGSAEHRALVALGWQQAAGSVLVMVGRLVDLLGEYPIADGAVAITQTPDPEWLAAFRRGHPTSLSDQALRRLVLGRGEHGYAAINQAGRIVGIGQAHVNQQWAGFASVWTDPQYRRRGVMTKIISELGRWAAEHEARNGYLAVRADNRGAQAAYQKLGLAAHHRYCHLVGPQSSP